MVIKSKGHTTWIGTLIVVLITTIAFISCITLEWGKSADNEILRIIPMLIVVVVLWYLVLVSWSLEGRTMIFDAEGVEVCFWKFSRKYFWSDFKTIRLEYFQRRTGRYKKKNEDPRRGIVFCTKQISKPHDEHPTMAAVSNKFLVYVTFPVDPDDKTERSDAFDVYIEPYEVDEEYFMTKMRGWNVPIENCLPEEMKKNYKW